MKKIKIEENVQIPGTNVMLEKGDSLLLKEELFEDVYTLIKRSNDAPELLSKRLSCWGL